MTPKGLRLLQDLRRQFLQPPAAKELIGQAATAAAEQHRDPAPEPFFTAREMPPLLTPS
jgi:hypothetical protein